MTATQSERFLALLPPPPHIFVNRLVRQLGGGGGGTVTKVTKAHWALFSPAPLSLSLKNAHTTIPTQIFFLYLIVGRFLIGCCAIIQNTVAVSPDSAAVDLYNRLCNFLNIGAFLNRENESKSYFKKHFVSILNRFRRKWVLCELKSKKCPCWGGPFALKNMWQIFKKQICLREKMYPNQVANKTFLKITKAIFLF